MISDELHRFAELMENKIQAVEYKYGDFRQYKYEELIPHLISEIKELLASGDPNEAIDIANLAYMIWYVRTKGGDAQ